MWNKLKMRSYHQEVLSHPARPAFAPGANHRSRTFSAPAHLVLVSDECSSFLKFCVYSTRQARGRCRLGGAPEVGGARRPGRADGGAGAKNKRRSGGWADRRTEGRMHGKTSSLAPAPVPVPPVPAPARPPAGQNGQCVGLTCNFF